MQAAHPSTLCRLLSGMLVATERLREGLRMADAELIFEAVTVQAEHLKCLQQCPPEKLGEVEREAASRMVEQLNNLNGYNQKLSGDGLRTIRASLLRLVPGKEYDEEGGTQLLGADNQLSTSA